MDIQEIKNRIEDIKAHAGDPESQHSREDDLRHDLLESIASGTCKNISGCAKLVLTTSDLDFERWCA